MFLFSCCTQTKKINIDITKIKFEGTLSFRHNSNQTIDSIIIINTEKTITSTGDSIYNIITKEEKRIGKIPNPFAPETKFMVYSWQRTTLFSINVYDTMGYEIARLVNKELPPGEYLIYFAIYTVLNPGVYILEINYDNFEQIWKLIIN